MATDKDYCCGFISYLLEEGKIVNNKIDKENAREIYKDSFKPKNKKKAFPFSAMYRSLLKYRLIQFDDTAVIFKSRILNSLIAKQNSTTKETKDATGSMSKSKVTTNQSSSINATPSNSVVIKTDNTSVSLKPDVQDISSKICSLCRIVLADGISFDSHLKTDKHKLLHRYVNNRDSLLNPVAGLTIEIEDNFVGIEESVTLRVNEIKAIVLKLINNSGKDYFIQDVIELISNPAITLQKSNESLLSNGKKLIFNIKVQFTNISYAAYPLLFRLKEMKSNKVSDVLKQLVFHIHSSFLDDMHAKSVYKKTDATQVDPINGIVRGKNMKRDAKDFKPAVILQQYNISDSLLQVFNNNLNDFDGMTRQQMFIVKDIRNLLNNFKFKYNETLNGHNYYEMLRLLLFLEEYQMKIEIQKYSLNDGTLLTASGVHKNCLELKVPGLAEHRPSLLRGDSVYVMEGLNSAIKYEGIVHQIRQDSVILGFSNKFMYTVHLPNKRYRILFGFNRVPVRAEHQAINLINDHKAISILCKNVFQERKLKDHELIWFNKNIANNLQQQQAVKHILSQTSRPMPYLIFGPPGTGKTVTIVEAVLQVWKLLPTKHMLVCAPSNNAADEIAKRLADIIPKRDLLRYVATNYPYELLYEKVKPYVNYRNGDYFHPANSTILNYRIVVCTLVNASRLVNGGTPENHFEYVFIDEGGQATESETLIPIAGILTSDTTKGTINGQIVLAGDPKQLGPIIHSTIAIDFGFATSMLERLMKNNTAYQKNEKEKYNEGVLTKLVQSYRSHPEILVVPNNLFYENELISAADETMTHIAIGWDHLPNPDFPIIFHSVFGNDERDQSSPSFFNIQEIDVVLYYLNLLIGTKLHGMKISEEHIGIIAPYRKQVHKLQQALNKKNYGEKLFIGSVEQFQGQERLIIIVTTVRSRPEYIRHDAKFHLGFLKNPKRFNVAITRAKALLIVIGNPKVLLLDPNWHAFIKHCKDNGSVRGTSFSLETSVCEITSAVNNLEINDISSLSNVEDGPNFSRGRI